jgi:hypothetical protein
MQNDSSFISFWAPFFRCYPWYHSRSPQYSSSTLSDLESLGLSCFCCCIFGICIPGYLISEHPASLVCFLYPHSVLVLVHIEFIVVNQDQRFRIWRGFGCSFVTARQCLYPGYEPDPYRSLGAQIAALVP